jgi:hypothetical protein
MCARVCVARSTLHGVKVRPRCGVREGAGRRRPGARLGAMTIAYDLLTRLRRDWALEGRGAAARLATERLRRAHPDLPLAGVADLYEVVERLEPGGGLSVLERARVVEALLEEATDPCLRRALLQTLLPGVVSVARQLRFGQGIIDDPGETVATALGLLAELLVDWAGERRPYAAPDLLSALRGRLRRWLLKEKAARAEVRPVREEAADEDSGLLCRLEALRHEHGRLARLTYARVFEGRPLAELAAQDHSSPVALREELRLFASRHLL